MCCLFGVLDYGHSLSVKQKNRIVSALAVAAEVRGTDATGIAYNAGGKLRIYKRPWPAHCMRFRIPEDARVIMGHTRLTTQGSARVAGNNHPFPGSVRNGPFALAHNGVLYNDRALRRALDLPRTKIETDSYIGVQLIEQQKSLDFNSLRYMAEQVQGSFAFTLLSHKNDLYLIKGDNPLCLYHDPVSGLYLYASTQEILQRALERTKLPLKHYEKIQLHSGDLLRIDARGAITRQTFDDSKLLFGWHGSLWDYEPYRQRMSDPAGTTHLDEIKSVAMAFGYAPEEIDSLAAAGFGADELEEMLYCGEL